MTIYEALILMVAFSTMMITLIAVIVAIVNAIKK